MECLSCTNNNGSGTPAGCKNNGLCASGGCNKLNVFNWLAGMELPHGIKPFDCVEVRFKNSRKEFFRNVNEIELKEGDAVAVEGSPGHDIGVVSLTGELVKLQMSKRNVKPNSADIKKLYRIARQKDIDKWQESRNKEQKVMERSRQLALQLNLEMKISDVEFQGDGTKVIFYYTAEGRVDFRELIKKYAEEFKVRIEMKQIGMRQEASRLGGIGSCGRELCCSTWLTDFRSVSTAAARYQQLSLNPMKLAGQCGKLKCCLNYELDAYVESMRDFPNTEIKLETKRGAAFFQKLDVFKRKMWYSYFENPGDFIELPLPRVKEVIEMNSKGNKPDELLEKISIPVRKLPDFENVVGQDSLTRFDKKKGKKKKYFNKQGNNNKNKSPKNNRPTK